MVRLPFNISLGLSKKKKAPVLYFLGNSFLPHQLLKFLALMRWVKIVHQNHESIIVELYGKRIKLLYNFFFIFVDEWKTWEKYYLPPFSLHGKTVLDVGAGCGETAFFYILYGAKKIIAIERDVKALRCLEENVKENNWNVEIIPEPFKIEHLNLPHDFMKMDIEGSEAVLLNLQINKPCIVEVHSHELMLKFQEKSFKKIYSHKKEHYVMLFMPDN
jgi:tRNA G37 N-methylase Trm5